MIIGRRTLSIDKLGAIIDVPITIFLPIEESVGCWTCRYEIKWPENVRSFFSTGVDAIQAIILALNQISTELYKSEYCKKSELYWYEPNNGFGFPLPNLLQNLAVGDDKNL